LIAKLFYSLRWKLVALFILSLILSIFSLIGMVFGLWFFERVGFRWPFLVASQLVDMFGVSILALGGCGFFFVVYIFVFSHRRIVYLVQITKAVQRFAEGKLDQRIEVRYKDEMGDLASNLNKMAEQLQTSIEEERRAERTKSELITNVSHDLRTPLTSIEGYLGLIEQDRYKDEVELRHYVHIAYEKTKRLHVLIDDLFEYTRLSGGSLTLKASHLDLVELIGQIAGQFQHDATQAGMQLRLSFPREKVPVSADGDKLVRVFENLLSNAIHYGKDGIFIDIILRKEKTAAVAQVINYGEPIHPHHLPFIFDRFYRVEQSRSADTGGSGLGLAISKQIVELHGGSIRAESDSNRTLFEVRLPLVQAQTID
jgi:signal transduction histidine kinase